MPISEILIVYLALGAPLAVYRFLETRRVSGHRRMLISLATFFFWIPFAIQLSARRLTNASNGTGFVSPASKKTSSRLTRKRLEAVRTAMMEAGCRLSVHDLREIIERYAGLSEVSANSIGPDGGEKAVSFFEAAGRSHKLASICFTRREQNRVRRHLDDARQSFLNLFDKLPGPASSRVRAIRRATELALVVEDMEAVERLGEMESSVSTPSRDEVTSSLRPTVEISR